MSECVTVKCQQNREILGSQLLLLLLLLTSSVGVNCQPGSQGRDGGDESVSFRNCSVGRRHSAIAAISETIDCFLETRILPSRLYRTAVNFTFGSGEDGLEVSGATERMLSRSLPRDDSDSFKKFADICKAFSDSRRNVDRNRLKDYKKFLQTSPFVIDTFCTLKANGLLSNVRSVEQFVDETLHAIWFKLYSTFPKDRRPDTNGFKRVMVGEKRQLQFPSTMRVNNWIRVMIYATDTREVKLKCFKMLKRPLLISECLFIDESLTSLINFKYSRFWIGTLPEFDLAVYTATFLANPYNNFTEYTMSNGGKIHVQTKRVPHQRQSVLSAGPRIIT